MTKYEIQLINEVIANAVLHGGDKGGSYDSNEEELLRVMNKLLGRINLSVKSPYYKIKFIYVSPGRGPNNTSFKTYQFVREI